MNYEVFYFVGSRHCSWFCVISGHSSHQSFAYLCHSPRHSSDPCQALSTFLKCMCSLVINQTLEGVPLQILGFSLYVAITFPVFCLVNLSNVESLESQFYILNSGRRLGSAWASAPITVWKLSLGNKVGYSYGHVIYFLCLKGHCFLLPDV